MQHPFWGDVSPTQPARSAVLPVSAGNGSPSKERAAVLVQEIRPFERIGEEVNELSGRLVSGLAVSHPYRDQAEGREGDGE